MEEGGQCPLDIHRNLGKLFGLLSCPAVSPYSVVYLEVITLKMVRNRRLVRCNMVNMCFILKCSVGDFYLQISLFSSRFFKVWM